MQPGDKFVRCLLDQKDEEHQRARRLRRRTLLISIVIQALVLTLLLLRPLFGAQEVPLVARWIPLPRYKGQPSGRPPEPHRPAVPHVRPESINRHPIWFPPPQSHPVHFDEDSAPDIGPITGNSGGESQGDPNGFIIPPGMNVGGNVLPEPPSPEDRKQKGPRRVPSEIQEALLIERIEPRYPPLAKQARIQGTVEIHAIIAADGSIKSAQIVSGNITLANAARDAVLRWRYRPTVLNGQPVEIETIIRVIFKLS